MVEEIMELTQMIKPEFMLLRFVLNLGITQSLWAIYSSECGYHFTKPLIIALC